MYYCLYFISITRLYWSTIDPSKRCLYSCHIEEIDEQESRSKVQVPLEKVAENHVVTCHENEDDIFDGSVSKSNNEVSKLNCVFPAGKSTAVFPHDEQKNVETLQSVTKMSIDDTQSRGRTSIDSNAPKLLKRKHSNEVNDQNKSVDFCKPSLVVVTSPAFSTSLQSKCKTSFSGSFPSSPLSKTVVTSTQRKGVTSVSLGKAETKTTPCNETVTTPRAKDTLTTLVTRAMHPNEVYDRKIQQLTKDLNATVEQTKGVIPKTLMKGTSATTSITTVSTTMTRAKYPVPESKTVLSVNSFGANPYMFPRTTSVSPMDFLVDLTRPKTNNARINAAKVPKATKSRTSNVKIVRTKPIPLAPKPTFVSLRCSPYRQLAPKPIRHLHSSIIHNSTQNSARTTTANSFIFHSTTFVSQGNSVRPTYSQIKHIKTTAVSTATFVQNSYSPSPITSARVVTLHPPANVVQSNIQLTSLNSRSIVSDALPSTLSSSMVPLKSTHSTSNIVKLNTDPSKLAANFLRLRANAVLSSAKPSSLLSIKTNSTQYETPNSVSNHLLEHASLQHNISAHLSKEVSAENAVVGLTKEAATSSAIRTDKTDGMAVVVGSPDQIKKLLSENPNMIQLLGSKSTEYLGKLLTSEIKEETKTQQQNAVINVDQIGLLSQTKEIVKPPVIDLTNKQSTSIVEKPRSESYLSHFTSNNHTSLFSKKSLDSIKDTAASTIRNSVLPTTAKSTISVSKLNIEKCRNAVRKLDRRFLNSSIDTTVEDYCTGAVGQEESVQSTLKSPTHQTKCSSLNNLLNVNKNDNVLNKRFLHANLGNYSTERKIASLSPLSSPAKLMAHIEDQTKSLKPFMTNLKQADNHQLPRSDNHQGVDTAEKKTSTKSNSKICIKRTNTKRKYKKRKVIDEISEGNGDNDMLNNALGEIGECSGSKKSITKESLIKGSDGKQTKKAKIDENDIVLPDFARVKQSDLRSRRLEKVKQELNVVFTITSEEGLEVKAKSCEGNNEKKHNRNFLIYI